MGPQKRFTLKMHFDVRANYLRASRRMNDSYRRRPEVVFLSCEVCANENYVLSKRVRIFMHVGTDSRWDAARVGTFCASLLLGAEQPFKAQWLLCVRTSLAFRKCMFCSQSKFFGNVFSIITCRCLGVTPALEMAFLCKPSNNKQQRIVAFLDNQTF